MNLAERVKAILQNPKSEWLVIESEPAGFAALFVKYAVVLAAIPPVCALIGAAFTGYIGYRMPFGIALKWALIAYGLSLISVLVTAFVIDALAVTFGGQRDFNKAMKVSVYAPTAAWAAGIFTIQPPIAFLFLTGLYSFYLLYTGLEASDEAAGGKAFDLHDCGRRLRRHALARHPGRTGFDLRHARLRLAKATP